MGSLNPPADLLRFSKAAYVPKTLHSGALTEVLRSQWDRVFASRAPTRKPQLTRPFLAVPSIKQNDSTFFFFFYSFMKKVNAKMTLLLIFIFAKVHFAMVNLGYAPW